ncbi:MAG: SDR family NAD(P)-dependent oxidoreductase [Bdellovibrionota bacterium]
MKILVTGGAGFIGSHVVDKFVEHGHDVVVLDNLDTGKKDNLPLDSITFVEGDIRDRALLAKAMKGVEKIVHLAASVGNKKSIEMPELDQEINYQGTLFVLEEMRKNNVTKIVFSSSAGIFGEPTYEPVDENHPCWPDSPYGVSKLAAERLILSYTKLYHLKAVCLRYFNVFGERQYFDAYGNVIPIFMTQALKQNPITIYGSGKQTRDFIYVGDIANANFESTMNDYSGVLNLGAGGRLEILELAKKIKSISKSSSEITFLDARPGDVLHCTASIEKQHEVLESPANAQLFDQHLAQYFEWAKNHLV